MRKTFRPKCVFVRQVLTTVDKANLSNNMVLKWSTGSVHVNFRFWNILDLTLFWKLPNKQNQQKKVVEAQSRQQHMVKTDRARSEPDHQITMQ